MLLDEIAAGARFLAQLPAFLRQRLDPAEARVVVEARLEQRSQDFLAIARELIYERSSSPYKALLGHAGCEYGDLDRLVGKEGLEETLRILCRQGVYVNVHEFKGRTPAVRGSASFAFDPSHFRNPCARAPLPVQTSGSGGRRTPVPIDLAYVRECAVNSCLMLDTRGGSDWIKAHWASLGSGAMMSILQFSAFGAPSARWFSQVDPRTSELHPRYRWSAEAMAWVSRLAAMPLPHPEYVPPDDPLPIALWMRGVLQQGKVPHLLTYPSSAVRLCEAARDAGVDIAGAQLTVSGEAVTPTRIETIRSSGASAVARFGTVETGPLGLGCLHPETSAFDEVHLLTDLHAVIQVDDNASADLPRGALYLSSLRRTAPFILLNVCMGDEAVLGLRECGCPLAGIGWGTHLHTIRSFEKLTGAGMTFLDVDVARLLESVLPARFGGTLSDYQLAEEEAETGLPRLRLLIHPRVGRLDEAEVIRTFLDALEASSSFDRVLGAVWRRADLIRVDRTPPTVGASGKILHLLRRRPDSH